MKTYIVSFEVTNLNAAAFVEALKSYNGYCPISSVCWAIRTDKTAVQVRDHLRAFLAATDRLFVVRSGTEAAWNNSYGPKYDEWLKTNL